MIAQYLAIDRPDLVNKLVLAVTFSKNAYEELGKIRCPIFVTGGRRDQVVTGETSEEIAEKVNCKIYMYEELGHAAYEEAKDLNRRVYQFFLN